MKTKKTLASFLLLFVFLCQFIIPTIVRADIGYTDNTSGRFPTDYTEIDGIIRNYRNQPIEYDEAFVSKTASKGEKDGEFYIDLKIEGKELKNPVKKDIVFVLDNSNSMKLNGDLDGNNEPTYRNSHDRVTASNNAIKKFLDTANAKAGNNVRFALVTYASDVFDGRYVNEFYFTGNLSNNSHQTLTSNINEIKNKLPNGIPIDRGIGQTGGTFTQRAMRLAADILDNQSPAENEKFIIHLTDGVPTRSFELKSVDAQGKPNFDYDMTVSGGIAVNTKGSGKAYNLIPIGDSRFSTSNVIQHAYTAPNHKSGGQEYITNHGKPTIMDAKTITNKYETFTIGVEMTDYTFNYEAYGIKNSLPWPHTVTRQEAIDIMKSISTTPQHYFDATNIDQISEMLGKIENEIFKTVQNGSVSDPMGDMVDLNLNANLDGNKFYKLTASDPSLIRFVTVNYDQDTRKISLSRLNLGKGEWVNLRYKVNLRTEDPQYKGNFFYPTNGPTTLTPNAKNPNTKRDFPVPSIKANTIDVNVQKVWKYKNGTELPDSMKKEIKVKLVRKSTNPNVSAADREKEIAEKTLNKAGNWTGTFEKLIPYEDWMKYEQFKQKR